MKLKSVMATQSQREEFDIFLSELGSSIAKLNAQAEDKGLYLDMNLNSLNSLEEFVIQQLDAGSDVDTVVKTCSGYLGEVFRDSVGGDWELCLKDRKYLYFGLPVVAGYATCAIEFCPSAIIRNFCYSRKKGILKTAIDADMEFKKPTP